MKSIFIIEIEELNKGNISKHKFEILKKEMAFIKTRKDTIGMSQCGPTWGYAFETENGKMRWKEEGLYKEYDMDSPKVAYSEKIASIIGKKLLKNIRVPDIEIVEAVKGESGLISYIILNNDKEDMFHIRDILFNKFERAELSSMRNIVSIKDILESIKIQVEDEENYKEIEKGIIHTLLFDALTNNGDRHPHNWALIRDKITNRYELGIFDHASCCVPMMVQQQNLGYEKWGGSYVKTRDDGIPKRVGDSGETIIKYIYENYKDYFVEFADLLEIEFSEIMQEIKNENLPIDIMALQSSLYKRKTFFNNIRGREEER